ncbi:unnamed protein product [Anisakis simplex]|uniref:riboflavin kinase n=1 Tax=Anisakis simplex TaxID=6269 RepID=A0A0M3JVX0_ANISI|nr:unnamed protein product [Anisakis simplex]
MHHFPYYFKGRVVTGFGRGGKQLGCPTANLDDTAVSQLPSDFPCGVFYGLAQVDEGKLYGMVMSVGNNPHFKNERKTIEVHILHHFDEDFYGADLRAVAIGYLRSMTAFNSLGLFFLAMIFIIFFNIMSFESFSDELKVAIKNDIAIAEMNLQQCNMEHYEQMDHFRRGNTVRIL